MKSKRIVLFCFLFFMSITSYAQELKTKYSLPTFFPKGSLSIRTNLVPYILLTPNLGLEYKMSDNVGLIVEGAFAHWSLNTTNKYWHIWNVSPQLRYYAGNLKNIYIGGQYTMGEYNLTGSQGSYSGGGLALGYQFKCYPNLLIDFGVSLGYLYVYDKEQYTLINGANIRKGPKTSDEYWGPTAVSVSFVWQIN